jgi:hypothetical protein
MAVVIPNGNFAGNSFFIIIIVLFIVMLQLRERKVKLRSLIIMPVILSLFTLPIVYMEMYSVFNVAVIFAGLLIGVLMGLLIGKFMKVKIHEDGSMILKGSFLAVLLWVAIIIIRIYGRTVLSSMGIMDLNLLTSVFLIMAMGAMISRRVYLYRKYMNFKKENTPSKD